MLRNLFIFHKEMSEQGATNREDGRQKWDLMKAEFINIGKIVPQNNHH